MKNEKIYLIISIYIKKYYIYKHNCFQCIGLKIKIMTYATTNPIHFGQSTPHGCF